jgi:hypothetical protein
VASCGGRQEVSSLLLAWHSPLLASVLGQGQQAISIDINLTVIRKMVTVLEGEEEQLDQDVKEAAELLDITFPNNKTNLFSGLKKGSSTGDSVKEITVLDSAAHLSTAKGQTAMKMDVKLEALESEQRLLDIEGVSSDSTESSDSSDEDDDTQENFMENVRLFNRKERRGRPKKERIIEVGQFHCSECRKNFQGPINLKKHMLRCHKLPIPCDMCDHKLFSVSNYTQHLRETHPSFQCSVCGV